jgi:hypothetical protein
MAAEAPIQSVKTLPNGGKLIIKTSSSYDSFWSESLYSHEYSYSAPSGVPEQIGNSSCLNSNIDGNPDMIFARKLMILPQKCHTGLYVRTIKNGWRYFGFDKENFEKQPLWLKSKEPHDDKYDRNESKIKAIDAKKLTVTVEYSTSKTNIMTFRLSDDGEKIDLISLKHRIEPYQDPVFAMAKLSDKSQPENIRAFAANILGNLKDPNAVDALISALSDGGFQLREAAIISLGQIGDKRATMPLLQLLGDKKCSMFSKNYTAKALGNIKDTRAVQTLIVCLNDENPSLRCESAKALGEIGDIRALEPLIKMSRKWFKEEGWVRRCAVSGLEHFKDHR